MYLCYDIKGIQRFIFSVPKLKCIVGGSSLIAEMDEWAKSLATSPAIERIFSGGGRGAFFCENQGTAQDLKDKLLSRAHDSGLDIRFGHAKTLSEAVLGAEELYPYCPKDLSGEPCQLSGIWPLGSQPSKYGEKLVHPNIKLRLDKARKDSLGEGLIQELRDLNLVPALIAEYELEFLSNVNPRSDSNSKEEMDSARCGYKALGSRNRWAIIAMDGNDMGRQFASFDEIRQKLGLSESDQREWLKRMSSELNQCTRQAFLHALGKVLADWTDQRRRANDMGSCVISDSQGTKSLILPFRPLILGGDDVTVLCHCEYAMTFVREMSERFTELSKNASSKAKTEGLSVSLWPATSDRLSISAGVLFLKTTFPLSMGIPYADSLLASAKGKFRESADSKSAATPAVDWETITDTLVDTPGARRRRELCFKDEDLDMTIELFQRPHPILAKHGAPPTGLPLLDQIIKRLKDLPRSIQADLSQALTRPYSERIRFVTSIAKRNPNLKDFLWELGTEPGPGWRDSPDGKTRSTAVLDALSLLDEKHRMDNPTDA